MNGHQIAAAEEDAAYYQADLFPDLVPVTYARELTTRDRWEAFHRSNPHVLAALAHVCLWRRRHGWTRWSIAGAFEEVRFGPLNSRGAEPWKLTNDFKPYYARELMDRYPDLVGFFELRDLKEDGPTRHPLTDGEYAATILADYQPTMGSPPARGDCDCWAWNKTHPGRAVQACPMCAGTIRQGATWPPGVNLNALRPAFRVVEEMTDPTEDPSPCRCGHPRSDHSHEPRGVPLRMVDGMCSRCDCDEFTPAGDPSDPAGTQRR